MGFSELGNDGRIYNSAAVFHRSEILGVYRKLYPAVRRSVYSAGRDVPVFRLGDLTFGILICNDSNYSEPAKLMAAQGANALFVPTNNSLPVTTDGAQVVAQARKCDRNRAIENGVWIIRADVAGQAGGFVSYGSSGIVDFDGALITSAKPMNEVLVIGEIDTGPCPNRRTRSASPDGVVAEHNLRGVQRSC